MKRSGGVTAAAIVLICASVFVALFELFAILGTLMVQSMSGSEFSVTRALLVRDAMVILIAVWGIVTAVGLLRLRRWAWISMLLVAGLLIYTAFPPVPHALKLIRETTGIPTISAPGMLGIAYTESAIRIFVPLALGLWWLVLFLRRSVRTQFGLAAPVAVPASLSLSEFSSGGPPQPAEPRLAAGASPDARSDPSPASESQKSRMERSGGVTAAAVVLFIGSALLVLLMGIACLTLLLPRPSGVTAGEQIPSLALGLLFYAIFAAWGIATGLGILRLKPWARISILVMSGFAVVGILFASLTMFLIVPTMKRAPGMDASFEQVFLVIWGVMLTIPLGIAIWWFVLFMLKSVRLQFASAAQGTVLQPTAAGGMAVSGMPEAPASSMRTIPVSIVVIAVFLLVGTLSVSFTVALTIHKHVPLLLFGRLVTGTKAVAAVVIMGALQLICGIALLRRKAWSLDATVVYAILATVNILFFFVSRSREAYFQLVFQSYQSPPNLPPDFFPRIMHSFMPAIMGFTVVVNLIALYFLWTRREAYRAACASK